MQADESASFDEILAAEQTEDDYWTHPGFNQSTANKLLSESPLHAYRYRQRQGKRKDVDPNHSRDREIGTVTHALILGSAKGYQRLDSKFLDYKTKEAQGLRSECERAGVTPILEVDFDRCTMASNAVREQLRDVFGLVLDGVSESPIYWTEVLPGGSLQCKAKPDHVLTRDMGRAFTILDVKSGDSANPRTLMRRILDAGYHVQAAAYSRGFAAVTPAAVGRTTFIDVFVETSGLIQVTPVAITGSLYELGERAWLKACERWLQCVQEATYPGYTTEILAPEAPEWALKQEMAEC